MMPHPDMVAKDAKGRAYLIQGQTSQFLCLDQQQHSNAGAASIPQCYGYQLSSSVATCASASVFTPAYREAGPFRSIGVIQRPLSQEQELEVLWKEISTGSFKRSSNWEMRPLIDRTEGLQLPDSSRRNAWMNSPFCPAPLVHSNGVEDQHAALINSTVSGPSTAAGLPGQSYFVPDHNIPSSGTGCYMTPESDVHSFMPNEEYGQHELMPDSMEDSLHMPCAMTDNIPDAPLQPDTSLIWGMQGMAQQCEQVQPSQSSQTPFSFASTHADGSGTTSPHLVTSQYGSSGTFAALNSPCLMQDNVPASSYSTPIESSVANSSMTKLSALPTPFSKAVAELGGSESPSGDHCSPPNSAPVVTTGTPASPPDLTSGPLSEKAAPALRRPKKMDVTALCDAYPEDSQAKVPRSGEALASPRSQMRLKSPKFKNEDSSPVHSSSNLAGLSSRESSQTLPDWNNRQGAGLRCSSGECSKPLEPPCDEHRCSCCKSGRKVVAYERQGYCAPCGKREIVSGLKYVRCGKCKAEMVERAYEAHLKQFVMMVDPVTGVKSPVRCRDFVNTHPRINLGAVDGKRCSKCSNMRPMSYYSSESGTCNWHLPQRHASRLARMTSCDDALSAWNSGELHLLGMEGSDGVAHITTAKTQQQLECCKISIDITENGRMASSFL